MAQRMDDELMDANDVESNSRMSMEPDPTEPKGDDVSGQIERITIEPTENDGFVVTAYEEQPSGSHNFAPPKKHAMTSVEELLAFITDQFGVPEEIVPPVTPPAAPMERV